MRTVLRECESRIVCTCGPGWRLAARPRAPVLCLLTRGGNNETCRAPRGPGVQRVPRAPVLRAGPTGGPRPAPGMRARGVPVVRPFRIYYLLKFSAPPWWQHNYITAWHDYNCVARL
jgi:hypothetical protein